uniref:Small ribosomal subunit protein uS10c n=1 Tax=Kalanchoe fedtschenkoi TaxID=63787 RepID=A0A7N0U1S3_KALFE
MPFGPELGWSRGEENLHQKRAKRISARMALSSSICATMFATVAASNSCISARSQVAIFNSSPAGSLKFNPLNASRCSTVVFAAPEVLDAEEVDDGPDTIEVGSGEASGFLPMHIGADTDKSGPKQKIRIKLRSYWVPLIEDSCKQILDAARTTNAKTMGPVPLPTKKRIYCVLKSPHVHKDARFHFEIRTRQRLIDILYPTAQTIDSLMQLDLPAGVDVEVKL